MPRILHQKIEQKLEIMARYLKFEIAFGKNNYIWIKEKSPKGMAILEHMIKGAANGFDE